MVGVGGIHTALAVHFLNASQLAGFSANWLVLAPFCTFDWLEFLFFAIVLAAPVLPNLAITTLNLELVPS